jgi:CRP/FNR family cyclic AMP-dependent transcriptional regulator
VDSVRIDWTGVPTKRTAHKSPAVIFSQGDACSSVLHIEQGMVRLSVVSQEGNAATVAIMYAGDFFGEGCLAGQSRRMSSAFALTDCTLAEIEPQELRRQLHAKPGLADVFLRHILSRNIRIEEDLVDQMFNSAEKRLARTLLLMARYGEAHDQAQRTLPHLSQTVLAEVVGTTRSRVNAFMNKFRKLGLIEYNGGLKVNTSLLAGLASDRPIEDPKTGTTVQGRTRRSVRP